MNLSMKQEQNHGHREQGEGLGGGMEWKVGVSQSKLLHIKWISNKVLLYSMGNCIQHDKL